MKPKKKPIETAKAKQAKHDYYHFGPQRSIEKLWKQYKEQPKDEVPTHRLATLRGWSVKWDWQVYVVERELELEKAKLEALKKKALETGYAVYYKRIHDLSELADMLFREIKNERRHWLQDVKSIGSGEHAKRVDIERFNEGIFRQYRGMLEDLAKEMGERKDNLRITGDADNPLVTKDISEVRSERWQMVLPALTQALSHDGSTPPEA